MKLGEVYLWETDKAQGYEKRRKFHVYICDHDNGGGSAFLYINSMDWYGDYKIAQAHFNFLSHDSFVGCSAVVQYSTAELKAAGPQLVGQLSEAHLKGLRDAIIAAETMEQRDANCVCKALAVAL
ncbi:MAG TPA: hypothetical protein VIJ67_06695 [Pseudolabrys sp.]